jgi:hypothetical protein
VGVCSHTVVCRSHNRRIALAAMRHGQAPTMIRTATISDDGLYRYRLGRRWASGPLMVWAMLNPSTADADVDDPTIRRCMGFANRERFGGIEVINLYALRATKPEHLLDHPDPEGPDNVRHWSEVLLDLKVCKAVAAWGAGAGMKGLPTPKYPSRWGWLGSGWQCLGQTKGSYPRHPLYVKADTYFELFRGASQR